MFTKILLILLSIPSFGGVGGIAGGGEQFQKGSQIIFLDDSTYVNVLSKTLCHHPNEFEVTVKKCADKFRDNCYRYQDVQIFQPKEDIVDRCLHFNGEQCERWGKVPFIQSPNRIIEHENRSGLVYKRERYKIPECK